jgi:hypothetical protein
MRQQKHALEMLQVRFTRRGAMVLGTGGRLPSTVAGAYGRTQRRTALRFDEPPFDVGAREDLRRDPAAHRDDRTSFGDGFVHYIDVDPMSRYRLCLFAGMGNNKANQERVRKYGGSSSFVDMGQPSGAPLRRMLSFIEARQR